MRDLIGRTAFITGAASGFGLALSRSFAAAGANVMLADSKPSALANAVEVLGDLGTIVRGVTCDVANVVSVEHAADATVEAFGKVHILCNTARVAGRSSVDDISLATWRRVLDVNLMGVLHGVRAFLPHLRAHGEGGHIVNTASAVGPDGDFGLSPSSASQMAVVAMSEELAREVTQFGIGVTVICSRNLSRRVPERRPSRPVHYASMPTNMAAQLAIRPAPLGQTGPDPSEVAAQVLAAIHEDAFYVFTP